MAKPKNLDEWGRSKAKERYAEGGDVESPAEDAAPGEEPDTGEDKLGEKPVSRASAVDEFIKKVMQDQVKKMDS